MPLALEPYCRQLDELGLISLAELRGILQGLPVDRRPKDTQSLIRELVRLHKLTSFQAQQVYQGKGKSLLLGNYVVLDKLGEGGMGTVLKGVHRRMRRLVALKVIRARSAESLVATRRFYREVEAAAKLIHPNIVTAFDADEADGTSFLVMEFVDGTDLGTLVKLDGPLPVDTAIHCVLQAARGLEYAHTKGVVHRDIKPRNLLLDRDGVVKILDMGLARVETSSGAAQTELTGAGQIMGTVDYMSPEQAVNPKQAGPQADVYSLGITLWYLLTGRVMYEGETVLEKLVAHRERPIPSLAEACPEAMPELDAVLNRMVAKRPQERFLSMTELIAELERCRIDPEASPTVQMTAHEGEKLHDFLRGMELQSQPQSAAGRAALASATFPVHDTVIDQQQASDTSPELERSLPASFALAPKPSAAAVVQRTKKNNRRTIAVASACAIAAALVAIVTFLVVFRKHLSPDRRPAGTAFGALTEPGDSPLLLATKPQRSVG